MIVNFEDPEVNAKGTVNFKFDTQQMLTSAIQTLGQQGGNAAARRRFLPSEESADERTLIQSVVFTVNLRQKTFQRSKIVSSLVGLQNAGHLTYDFVHSRKKIVAFRW
jgi:hypothetical protein